MSAAGTRQVKGRAGVQGCQPCLSSMHHVLPEAASGLGFRLRLQGLGVGVAAPGAPDGTSPVSCPLFESWLCGFLAV